MRRKKQFGRPGKPVNKPLRQYSWKATADACYFRSTNGSTINVAAFTLPGINQAGPYSRFYLRNPTVNNQYLPLFKNFRFNPETRYLQFRVEAFNVFNHAQFSGYNLTTNITNAVGETGRAIFHNLAGLTVINTLRPAGSAAVLGTYFGERDADNAMRVVQLAVKFYC